MGPSDRSSPTRGLASPPRWLARGVEARSIGPGHTGELINPTGPLPQRTGLQTRSCHVAPPASWPPLPPALASHHPIAKEPPSARKFSGSSGGSVQALKKVDMLAQSNVASSTPFRLETQHVHQLVVPCVRDSGIHLHSDSLRWRNHPLCHRPGEKTVVLLGLRLVGSTPTWSNRENVSNPPHRTQTRGHSLRGSARTLRVLRSDPTGRDWVCG